MTTFPGATLKDDWQVAARAAPRGTGLLADSAMIAAMIVVAVAAAHVLAKRLGVPPGMASAAGAGLLMVSAALHWRITARPASPAVKAKLPQRPAARPRKARPRPQAAAQAAADAAQIATSPVPVAARHSEAADLALERLGHILALGSGTAGSHSSPPQALSNIPSAPPLATLAPSAARVGQVIPASFPEVGVAQVGEETELQRVDRLVRRLADQVNRVNRVNGVAESLPHPPRHRESIAAPAPSAAGHSPAGAIHGGNTATDSQLAASIDFLKAGLASPAALPPSLPPVEPGPALSQPIVPDPAFAQSQQLVLDLTSALAALPPRPMTEFQRDAGHGAVFQRDAILSALNAKRIDVYLEPILELEGQRPQHYEVSIGLRGANGQVINLAETAADLSGTGLLPLIDSARITKAAELARRLASRGKTGAILTGLNSETLMDGDFQATFAGEIPAGAFPGQMVLTLQQAHVRLFTAADWQTLGRLSAVGFAFGLTGVSSLEMDFAGLREAGFAFARLDAEVFLNGLPVGADVVPPADICRHLAAAGLTLIVGAIADDEQLARIFGFGALFGQGQLSGGARPVAAAATRATPGGAVGAQ